MRRTVITAFVVGALLAGCDSSASQDQVVVVNLIRPVQGVLNSDVFLTDYVDDNPADGVAGDYNCGGKTFDGHAGTDFYLRDFAAMDSGVTVVAAAAGTVYEGHDGDFDRETDGTTPGYGNGFGIDMGNGYTAIYAHLKSGSVLVDSGQQVVAGQPLGLVGSSGQSTHPHLHFEMRFQGVPIDPYLGNCGPTISQWATQDPYQNQFTVVNSGVVNDTMTLVAAKGPPPLADTIVATDAHVSMWVELANLRAGTTSTWVLYDSSGTARKTVTLAHPRFNSLGWWWATFTTAGVIDQTGDWRIDYTLADTLRASRSFYVASFPAPAPPRSAPAGATAPAVTAGGGGVHGG